MPAGSRTAAGDAPLESPVGGTAAFAFEPRAVFARGQAELAQEGAAEHVGAAKAHGRRDAGDARAAAAQARAGLGDAQLLDVLGRCEAERLAEAAAELAHAQMAALRELLGRKIAVEIAQRPGGEFAEAIAGLDLKSQRRRTLFLVAVAFDVNHEFARDFQRQRRPFVLGDQCQCEINAGADAGRGIAVAGTQENRVRLDGQARIARRERLDMAPVRGHAAAVEQSGLGQRVGAGADRGDAAQPRRLTLHPVRYRAERARAAQTVATGNDQGIQRRRVRKGRMRHDLQPRFGAHRARRGSEHDGRIRRPPAGLALVHELVRDREHFQRPAEVERIEGRKHDEADPARSRGCRHAASMPFPAAAGDAAIPTIPATTAALRPPLLARPGQLG